jgi:hypothetical protein
MKIFSFFEEQDGSFSMSRLLCFVLVAAYIFLMIHSWGIPERTSEFAALVVGLYGANKLGSALQSFGKKPDAE